MNINKSELYTILDAAGVTYLNDAKVAVSTIVACVERDNETPVVQLSSDMEKLLLLCNKEVEILIRSGKKITAIKLLRDMFNAEFGRMSHLIETKSAVEKFTTAFSLTQYAPF